MEHASVQGSSDRPFADQVAVVTGASSGIGRAITLALAERGSTVHAVGRRADALEGVVDAARRSDAKVCSHQVDLEVDEQVEQFATRIHHVNTLVHSAGVIKYGSVLDGRIQDLDWHYRVNLRAPFLLTQLLLPQLLRSKGQVVFINTSAGSSNGALKSHYAASKHGLVSLADSLRDEVNSHGIRVLSVFPGRIATPMQKAVCEMEGREYHEKKLMQPQDLAKIIADVLLAPRSVEVTNISVRNSNNY